jgi:ribosome-binding factor A
MSKRIEKVNALIRGELSQIILREMEFPKGVLVTITRVESLVNLSNAKIYMSVMPEENLDKVMEILTRNVYHIQQSLNKRLNMRPIPKIIFKKEEKTKQAGRIEELLEELKKE